MIRIKQRKDDCHYETSIETSAEGGYMPIVIGYGFSQQEADNEVIKKFLEGKIEL